MKKAKLMLLAITVFAAVGGALAFSVKDTTNFCTTFWDSNGFCSMPEIVNLSTTSELETGVVSYKYTIAAECTSQTPCESITTLFTAE